MANNVHDIINNERKKRKLPHVYWSQEMAHLAQSQADFCARVGHLTHSDRFAFQGGENLAGGTGRFTSRAIVNCWLKSKAGHREYLLSPRVCKAGVGIAKRNGKTFAAWAFSDSAPTEKDCPGYAKEQHKKRSTHKPILHIRRSRMLRTPIKLALGIFGILGITLGAHGLYVYFSRMELLFGGEAAKLFLAIEMPIRLRSLVEWASFKGLQSWFIPAAILAGGIMLFNASGVFDIISKALTRLKTIMTCCLK